MFSEVLVIKISFLAILFFLWRSISTKSEISLFTEIFPASAFDFVIIIPGYKSATATEDGLKKIRVVPNPYVAHSEFNETEYLKKIRFTHLPAYCKITIYTITGEMVNALEHDNEDDGSEEWDLRTVNNQEVSPGLYIYLVESTDSDGKDIKHVGKFAIIR